MNWIHSVVYKEDGERGCLPDPLAWRDQIRNLR